MPSEAVKAAVKDALNRADAIAAKAEGENRNLTEGENNEIVALMESAKGTIASSKQRSDIADQLKTMFGDEAVDATKYDSAEEAKGRGSIGEQFIKSSSYGALKDRYFKSGHMGDDARFGSSDPVQFGAMGNLLKSRGSKAIITGNQDASAGALVYPDYRPLEDPTQLFRELSIEDLCAHGTTGSDLLSYPRVVSYTNNAAPVPEAQGVEPYVSGTGNVQGLKPQSGMVLETITTSVKQLAHWLPVTKRALSDAPYIRTLIDGFLRYGLQEELEDQILKGDGTGENFDGITHVSGTTAQPWTTDLLTTTLKAKNKVRLIGRGRPTAFVFSVADNEKLDLLRDGNGGTANSGAFLFGGPAGVGVQTLWGLPRIASEALSDGQFICADFRFIEVVDREQTSVQLFEQHADFAVRNLAAVLAELRAALLIHRPKSIVIGATAAS